MIALSCEHQVLGPAHPDEGLRLGHQRGVGLLEDRLVEDRVGVRHHGVVLVQRPGLADDLGAHLGAQPGQAS